MNYKARLRIPTETYAFIEVDVEGTPDEIVSANFEFTKLTKPNEGLPHKEWNQALDRYLTSNDGETETYLAMSAKQKDMIQELKKAFKRINKE